MRLETGMVTDKLRMRLVVQSDDAETHSILGDNEADARRVLQDLSTLGRKMFQDLLLGGRLIEEAERLTAPPKIQTSSAPRGRIVEHLMSVRVSGSYILRAWIEADENFGGVTKGNAEAEWSKTVAFLRHRTIPWNSIEELALAAFDALPSANEIEVTDPNGFGTVIYRTRS